MVVGAYVNLYKCSDASATEVTRGSEEHTEVTEADREYVHTWHTGSAYCCVTP